MFYTIYKITNLVNRKIYIGAHKTSKLDDNYMGSGEVIKSAINKYGKENFKKEYLEIFDNSEEMFLMEAKLVTKEFIKEDTNYNLKEGGYGGFDYINKNGLQTHRVSSEDSKKGQVNSIKSRIKNGGLESFACFKGKTHSDETKARMRESQKGKQSGEKNSQFGARWVYNISLNISKKITEGEIESYLAKGWKRGRKIPTK